MPALQKRLDQPIVIPLFLQSFQPHTPKLVDEWLMGLGPVLPVVVFEAGIVYQEVGQRRQTLPR